MLIRSILFFVIAGAAIGFPQNLDQQSLVVSSTKPPETTSLSDKDKSGDKDDEQTKLKPYAVDKPKITEMNIFANVTNRFSIATITSRVKNFEEKAKEATFSVVLPDSAYITGFIMEIDGKNYTAYIQEKEKAKQTYDEAVQSGIGAAHVAVSARDSNRFTVSVNVEPQSKASFYLTYEELLKRNQEYELVINIHPGQPVPNLNVDVLIQETKPLKFVRTPPLRSGNEIKKIEEDVDPRAVITNIDEKTARVKFTPDFERQKELGSNLGGKENDGLSGQFVVQYDVERESNGGEVLLKDGYFVHFFAPSDIKPLPKHVVFVLDTSGSMWGQRIDQLKQAMNSILGELKDGQDLFNLVQFESYITVWDINDPTKNVKFPNATNIYESKEFPVEDTVFPDAYTVDPDVTKKAKDVVKNFNAEGGTNIYDALKVAVQLVKQQQKKKAEQKLQPLIIFLTDGEATVGETNVDKIISKVSEINVGVPIFSLSFGDGADRSFLQKISLKNDGFSRHIYEAADASLQLQGFYKEISSPLLKNVEFKYAEETKKLTKTEFPIYFGGGEIVICGYLGLRKPENIPPVKAWGINGPIDLVPKVEHAAGEMERVWAYLTIKQLLDEKETAKNKTEVEKKALDLALKYSFVTPLTSLVVVKPNETSKAVSTEAADSTGPAGFSGGYQLASFPPAKSPTYLSSNRISGAMYGPPMPIGSVPYAMPGLPGNKGSWRPMPTRYTVYATTSTMTNPSADSISESESAVENASEEPSKLERLLKTLPWLSMFYTEKDDTLKLPQGSYKLGLNAVVNETNPCSNAPNNATAHCTLIQNCEKIHTILTNVNVYTQHFCAIESYGGVCCPV